MENRFWAKGIVYNFLIALVALILTWLLGGPKMDIELKTALSISSFLFIVFLALMVFSLYSVSPRERLGAGGKSITGPYKYIRHPACAAIIYFFNPALAIVFRSWLYFLSCVIIYFVWKYLVENGEVAAAKELGEGYQQYRLDTNLFFPDIYSINQPFYFLSVGFLIFAVVFIALNFSSLSFRYVSWDRSNDFSATTVSGVAQNEEANQLPEPSSPAREEVYDKPDSIVIEEIGLNAPLIHAQSSEQKELNRDLNSGVVIYPGSDPPGQIGNFFLTGHSSVYPWNKTIYGRVFAALDKLEIGDTVVIYLQRHKYEYRITNKYTAASKDIRLVHPADEAIITLMTCWPIGTNLKRLVAEGVLTNSH